MLQPLACLLVLIGADPATPAADIGLAYNENFIVSAPTRQLAEAVLHKAEQYRKELALKWLGEELPRGIGATSIQVKLSESADQNASSVAIRPSQRYHLIWLKTSRSKALGTALAHEIAHTVLATQFRDSLPAWVEEGIAGLEDDQQRKQLRQKIIAWYARSGNWPDIRNTLRAQMISDRDLATHAVAGSLTQFLLTRGTRTTLLQFALAGKSNGWDGALRQYYGIASVAELQRQWQQWAAAKLGTQPQGASQPVR